MEKLSISLDAPAKINLFLDVVSRRGDGYHNIKSIMQTVSLYDTIDIAMIPAAKSSINLSCNIPFLPTDRGNLAYRAAELILDTLDREGFSVEINITKRIPVCAGLAGGSTDAAAVLCGINALLGNPLCKDRLCELGVTLGADVPFCIMQGTKTAGGKGEILSDCPAAPQMFILIASEGERVSTPAAYSALDCMYDNFTGREPNSSGFNNMISALSSGRMKNISDSLYNIFEDAILPGHNMASKIKSIMLSSGATGALMSGSGPSVFGIFDNESQIRSAASALKSQNITPFICRPV